MRRRVGVAALLNKEIVTNSPARAYCRSRIDCKVLIDRMHALINLTVVLQISCTSNNVVLSRATQVALSFVGPAAPPSGLQDFRRQSCSDGLWPTTAPSNSARGPE